jgi:hypothetical protein
MEKSEPKSEYYLKGIELLKGSINIPAIPNFPLVNFKFNINVESKLDPGQNFVFFIINIDVLSEDQQLTLGSVSVSCIYYIVNFEEVIKVNEESRYKIPPKLVEALASTSFSTTRGIMFSTFKGTFLHNAILPLMDPQQFRQQ